MKILHLIDSGGIYGAEIMMLNLVQEQIRLGLKPIIGSIGKRKNKEKPIEREAQKRNFKVKKFRMIPGPNISGVLKILRYIEKHDIDLLHSHGYKGNILFGFLPKRFRKIPMIATIHGYTSTSVLTKNWMYEYLDILSHKYIDSVVLVNKGMLEHKNFKNNKINYRIINNGIPIENKKQTLSQYSKKNLVDNFSFDKAILDFCNNGFTIGSIGRLSPEKGYNYLIEALEIIIKKGIIARLIIIGEGPDRRYLQKLIHKKNLKNYVQLPGYHENAKKYLPYFNVYIISSLTEGLPITLLEAMQARIPIVATEVGGITKVLKHQETGLLIKPCMSKEIANSICNIYRNYQFVEKMIDNSFRLVNEKYSADKMAINYIGVYNDIIKNNNLNKNKH